ncbi:unnamed protein product [Adineta ricciae]|uniref:FYVE-type domain-containing protein n=1 Tax=Adineta ricciae TaxID=249248 RepID=A0A813RHT2_ADIRI|nr:unnamed protein product [Adineta ricciae]
MDFDIDAVLDQLEKKLNQSDLEEKQAIETPPAVSTSASASPPSTSPLPPIKSVDDLSLFDLDPLSHSEYQTNEHEGSKLDSFQQDLQDLYASSIVVDPLVAPSSVPILPDVPDQQEDVFSTSLPLAVEQLEIEVREEILQHTQEQPLPDGHHEKTQEATSLSTSIEEEQQSPLATTDTKEIVENESDCISHDASPTQTQSVLHSVDSIVNATTMADLEDYVAPNPSGIDVEPLQTSSELLFTPCEDNEENTIEIPSEEMKTDELLHLPLPSSSTLTTSTTQSQDFDLVKNILSEIFDKPEEELLDEDLVDEKETNVEQQEPLPIAPTNNNEDFRFLDEMLASIDVSDADIHQLTPAEIERVDNLLKDIANLQQTTEENQSDSQSPPFERPPTPVEATEVPAAAAAAAATAAAVPVDEELVRVEQEWAKLTDEQKRLGSIAPDWVSDDLAPACMKCTNKFSITRRRHHCRACGKVFCSTCCWQKVKLIHDDSKEDRACNDCVKTITEGKRIGFILNDFATVVLCFSRIFMELYAQ